MLPPSRITRSTSEPPGRNRAHQAWRGLPTTICVALCCSATRTSAAATSLSWVMTTSAPSSRARARFRSSSFCASGAGGAMVRRGRRATGAALRGGEPACPAHEPGGEGTGADGHQQALAAAPDGLLRHAGAHFAQLAVDAFGRVAQGQLAQGGEVRFLEEIIAGCGGALAEVDFSFLEALPEGFGGSGRRVPTRRRDRGPNRAPFPAVVLP